jgi:cytochrome c oxidase assembly protein subunit 15
LFLEIELRSRSTTGREWLCGFAVLTAVATLALIGVGGLVTSHGAGMAVPDWPTSYGYNMFALPFSKWVGGVFYEHTHRLVASSVGFLTMILAGWLWVKEERRWLRWLGVIALFAVIAQGVLGGLRVTLLKQELGIFHATLAQVFLVLVCSIAFFLSDSWKRLVEIGPTIKLHGWLRPALVTATLFILVQLVLGATMRHQHAGLAVPDFPLAYGQAWPRTDDKFIEEINAKRVDSRDFNPITANQIYLHMAHRVTAICITALVLCCIGLVRKSGAPATLRKFVYGWGVLIALQATLGALTVLTNKAADVATLHVLCGAVSLAWGAMVYIGTAPVVARVAVQKESTAPAGAPVLT